MTQVFSPQAIDYSAGVTLMPDKWFCSGCGQELDETELRMVKMAGIEAWGVCCSVCRDYKHAIRKAGEVIPKKVGCMVDDLETARDFARKWRA